MCGCLFFLVLILFHSYSSRPLYLLSVSYFSKYFFIFSESKSFSIHVLTICSSQPYLFGYLKVTYSKHGKVFLYLYYPLVNNVKLLIGALENLFIRAEVLSSDGLAGVPVILNTSTTTALTAKATRNTKAFTLLVLIFKLNSNYLFLFKLEFVAFNMYCVLISTHVVLVLCLFAFLLLGDITAAVRLYSWAARWFTVISVIVTKR